LRTLDLLRLIWDNLRRQRGRVALTALGVVIGTASIVMLVSLASGLQQSIINQFTSMGSLTTLMVQMNYGGEMMGGGGGGMAVDGGGMPSQIKKITNATIREIEAMPNVSKVVIRLMAETGGPIRVGKLESYPGYMGMNINDLSLLDIPMQEGTNVIKRGEAIIGADVLKNFYNPYGRPGDPPPEPPDLLNKRVSITLYKYTQEGEPITRTVDVKIVGIVKEMTEYSWAMVMPLTDIESWNEWGRGKRINRNQEGYPELIVKVDSMDSVLPVADEIKNMGYMVYTQMEYVRQIQSTFTIMQIVFGGIGAIALFVAAIGIANTMTMAILERTHEIGLMKAVGATNRDVLAIFLGESASIGLTGGVLGAALGWGLSKFFDQIMGQAMSGFMYLPPEAMQNAAQTPAWLILFAIVFATLIGLLSGLYPSIRAAMMEPVIALKYE
jgi:putative ABC transport system permease protein